jgi:regulatory protein
LQRALRFLGYRPRSEAEVLTYLARRGYSTAVAKTALEKLRSSNYLNDESFARDWARSRFANRGYGPKRIEQELKTKRVAEALIRGVLRETFGHGEEAQKAGELLKKKFKSEDLDDPKILRRAAAFLQRRGYSNKVIFYLLKLPAEDD